MGLYWAAVGRRHCGGRNSACKGREVEKSKLPKLKDHLPKVGNEHVSPETCVIYGALSYEAQISERAP